MKLLKQQSNSLYILFKDEETSRYYIEGVKEGRTILIGDKDDAESFILYGVGQNKTEINKLFN